MSWKLILAVVIFVVLNKYSLSFAAINEERTCYE